MVYIGGIIMSDNTHRDGLAGTLLLISGLVIGAATTLLYLENRPKKPALVLEQAKAAIGSPEDIEGGWIDYDPIEYTLFDSRPLVYVGGVSKREGDKLVQYQFVCDIYTGELLDSFVIRG